MSRLCVLVLLSIFIIKCESFLITLEARQEVCFFDRVKAGSRLTLLFEVAEGGQLDIDVKLLGPNDNVLQEMVKESDGKLIYKADNDGKYTYCFSNKISTVTPKILAFSMDIGDFSPPHSGDLNNDHDKLESMIRDLSTSLTAVKHEQEYMEIREKVHRNVNDSTNHRVVVWSFFEAVLLLTMTLGQVYYLKRFFEVRRII